MIQIEISEGNHQWEKTNLVTLTDRKKKGYDTYRCKCCGLHARMYSFGILQISDRSCKKVARCPGLKASRQLRITQCRAVGLRFANLTPGSIHDIIPPPPFQDDKGGEWVMGVGEPVKVLFSEFEYLSVE